ncbi:hypothetical protein IKG20_01950 [Candidatus Saccharibacteria bacterium]|nr:hypothetical protein [Candidatus Saccharibacteria bacterium]
MADVEFHSKNIAETKAKKDREVFVNVQEKKTIRQSAEEFQKKFAEAKAHASESRAKIENPGADENGVIRTHKQKTNWKPIIAVLIIIIIGITAYYVYPLIDKALTPTFEEAYELIKTDYEKGFNAYQKIINHSKDKSEKSDALARRSYAIIQVCDGKCLNQIKSDANEAEKISPSPNTAWLWHIIEYRYGSEDESENWIKTANSRGGISGWWDESDWTGDFNND